MPRVYVSIGSNIEREKNIRGAVQALTRHFGEIALSSVYESKADGFEGDDFYNLVAAFNTEDSLETLRDTLSNIEAAHGRTRSQTRYASRTLDIDILLYGDLVRHEGRVDIPRREIVEHAYVLQPLAELAPDNLHPETGDQFKELWQNFGGKQTVRRLSMDLT